LTAVAVLDPCSLCISCSAHACSRTGDYRPCTCTRTRTLRFRRTLRNCTAPAVPPTPYDPVPLIPSMPLPRVVLRELFPSASQLFFVLSFPRGVVTAAGLPSLCLCTFLCLCFDLDFTCPYQSTSSLHRGQRRAERLSYPPAGLEGSSLWLVLHATLAVVTAARVSSRSRRLRRFKSFQDLSDAPTCRTQPATFSARLGASTRSPRHACLATNESFAYMLRQRCDRLCSEMVSMYFSVMSL